MLELVDLASNEVVDLATHLVVDLALLRVGSDALYSAYGGIIRKENTQ